MPAPGLAWPGRHRNRKPFLHSLFLRVKSSMHGAAGSRSDPIDRPIRSADRSHSPRHICMIGSVAAAAACSCRRSRSSAAVGYYTGRWINGGALHACTHAAPWPQMLASRFVVTVDHRARPRPRARRSQPAPLACPLGSSYTYRSQ